MSPVGARFTGLPLDHLQHQCCLPRVYRRRYLQYPELRSILLNDGEHSGHDSAKIIKGHYFGQHEQSSLLAVLLNFGAALRRASHLLPIYGVTNSGLLGGTLVRCHEEYRQ